MKFVKPILSSEETKVLEELLKLAGGMACKGEISRLNQSQSKVIQALKIKGYVRVTKLYFRVLLPP